MDVSHTTTIHATCPHGCWDYYSVTFQPDDFMRTEDFERACDTVRGLKLYQEELAKRLSEVLPRGELLVSGMHGPNVKTECATSTGQM